MISKPFKGNTRNIKCRIKIKDLTIIKATKKYIRISTKIKEDPNFMIRIININTKNIIKIRKRNQWNNNKSILKNNMGRKEISISRKILHLREIIQNIDQKRKLITNKYKTIVDYHRIIKINFHQKLKNIKKKLFQRNKLKISFNNVPKRTKELTMFTKTYFSHKKI